jgi:hypothetical protein
VSVVDWWRLANSLVSLTALVWLLVDLRRFHGALSRRRLYLTLSLAGFLLAVTAGGIEASLQGAPVGARTVLVTAASVWCLLGLLASRKDGPS